MRHTTVAVIGHVDHGKTSLVKALTGIETDTLKEEQTRGLSIALGFAFLRQGDHYVHVIDTPGHADFIRMTASGVSGSDMVLLVVSAVDGIQPQTRAHIKLAHLFGVEAAIVAITKTDLADAKAIDALKQDIAELLADSEMAPMAIVACASPRHAGIDALAAALFEHGTTSAHVDNLKGFFLPIDRVFSAQGVGTIVTGTLRGQALQTGALVAIGPDGLDAHIRGLQVCGVAQDAAAPGARVAVNLRDVDRTQVSRGHVLHAPERFPASHRFDVAIRDAPSLKHMEQIVLLHGTSHSAARVRLYPASEGAQRFGQLEFSAPQTAYRGQRFVLRRPSSGETVTGGIILDPNAALITRKKPEHVALLDAIHAGTPVDIAHALAARDQGAVDLSTLARLSDIAPVLTDDAFEETQAGLVFRCREIETVETQVQAYLTTQHTNRPLRPASPVAEVKAALRPVPEPLVKHAIKRLSTSGMVRQGQAGIALKTHDPIAAMSADQKAALEALETRLLDMALRPAALFQNPSQDESDLTALLVWQGTALSLYNHSLKQTLLLHRDAVEAAQQTLQAEFGKGAQFTTGQARALLDTNRKTIVPLLEHFDHMGLTVRSGDLRTFRP